MKHLTLLTIFLGFSLLTLFSQNDPDPLRFAKQIEDFDSLDMVKPVPENCVLFLGSSSMRMWKTAESTFQDYNVINRGFGGSQHSDALYYFSRLVLRYRPTKIVFYEGDNDIAAGKSPERILSDFKKFVALVEEYLPETELGFVAIKPSPSRWDMSPQMIEANNLIKAYCETNSKLTFIDVWPKMVNSKGAKQKLFIKDMLHMNEKGYKIWTKKVEPFLKG